MENYQGAWMKRFFLLAGLFFLATLTQASTINVYSYGDYGTNPYAGTVTVLTQQAVSILNPSTYGAQQVYWFNYGQFPAGPNSQDTSLELISVNSINATPVTIGAVSYTILNYTPVTARKYHSINQINALQFTISGLVTATDTNTVTQTATNTVTPTSTFTKTSTFTATNTATPTATITGTINTPTFTSTATNTITNTSSATPTPTKTVTPTPTKTNTATLTPTVTLTPIVSYTPTINFTLTPIIYVQSVGAGNTKVGAPFPLLMIQNEGYLGLWPPTWPYANFGFFTHLTLFLYGWSDDGQSEIVLSQNQIALQGAQGGNSVFFTNGIVDFQGSNLQEISALSFRSYNSPNIIPTPVTLVNGAATIFDPNLPTAEGTPRPMCYPVTYVSTPPAFAPYVYVVEPGGTTLVVKGSSGDNNIYQVLPFGFR